MAKSKRRPRLLKKLKALKKVVQKRKENVVVIEDLSAQLTPLIDCQEGDDASVKLKKIAELEIEECAEEATVPNTCTEGSQENVNIEESSQHSEGIAAKGSCAAFSVNEILLCSVNHHRSTDDDCASASSHEFERSSRNEVSLFGTDDVVSEHYAARTTEFPEVTLAREDSLSLKACEANYSGVEIKHDDLADHVTTDNVTVAAKVLEAAPAIEQMEVALSRSHKSTAEEFEFELEATMKEEYLDLDTPKRVEYGENAPSASTLKNLGSKAHAVPIEVTLSSDVQEILGRSSGSQITTSSNDLSLESVTPSFSRVSSILPPSSSRSINSFTSSEVASSQESIPTKPRKAELAQNCVSVAATDDNIVVIESNPDKVRALDEGTEIAFGRRSTPLETTHILDDCADDSIDDVSTKYSIVEVDTKVFLDEESASEKTGDEVGILSMLDSKPTKVVAECVFDSSKVATFVLQEDDEPKQDHQLEVMGLSSDGEAHISEETSTGDESNIPDTSDQAHGEARKTIAALQSEVKESKIFPKVSTRNLGASLARSISVKRKQISDRKKALGDIVGRSVPAMRKQTSARSLEVTETSSETDDNFSNSNAESDAGTHNSDKDGLGKIERCDSEHAADTSVEAASVESDVEMSLAEEEEEPMLGDTETACASTTSPEPLRQSSKKNIMKRSNKSNADLKARVAAIIDMGSAGRRSRGFGPTRKSSKNGLVDIEEDTTFSEESCSTQMDIMSSSEEQLETIHVTSEGLEIELSEEMNSDNHSDCSDDHSDASSSDSVDPDLLHTAVQFAKEYPALVESLMLVKSVSRDYSQALSWAGSNEACMGMERGALDDFSFSEEASTVSSEGEPQSNTDMMVGTS